MSQKKGADKPGSTKPKVTDQDFDRFLNDARERSKTQPRQVWSWVRDTESYARKVAAGNRELMPLFVIRLYGVLYDLYARKLKIREGWLEVRHHPKFPREVPADNVAALERQIQAIEAVRVVFTEDEAVYMQYRRHVECHPFQDAYNVKLNSNGVTGDVKHHLIEKTLAVEETDQLIGRVLRRHADKLSDAQIAALVGNEFELEFMVFRDLAVRSLEPLSKLREIWSRE